ARGARGGGWAGEVSAVVVAGRVGVVVDADVVVEVGAGGAVGVENGEIVVVVGSRAVVVVDADVVVEVVAGGAVVVEVADVVVVVGSRAVVVVVVGAVRMGRKLARTMCQVSVAPRVRLPGCGPAAQARMCSRSA